MYDWEAFKVGDDHYLLSAEHVSHEAANTSNRNPGVTTTTSSAIYRWLGVEKFVLVHRITSCPATDWETFVTDDGDVYLVCANRLAGVSQLFKVKMV